GGRHADLPAGPLPPIARDRAHQNVAPRVLENLDVRVGRVQHIARIDRAPYVVGLEQSALQVLDVAWLFPVVPAGPGTGQAHACMVPEVPRLRGPLRSLVRLEKIRQGWMLEGGP